MLEMIAPPLRPQPAKRCLLRTAGLSKSFGGVQAVADLSFGVDVGDIVALIGPNGAGKTTAFNLISGVVPQDAGEVWLGNESITGLDPHQTAARGIGRTFQNVQIFGNMSVVENVAVGRHRLSRTGLLGAALRLPSSRHEEREIIAKAHHYLAWVGLGDRAAEMASFLPFGQQRLLEIARSLATEPRLILLDEPAAGLNSAETENLAELIFRIRDSGVTVVLVEHDMDLVMDIADMIVVLDYGRKIAEGTADEVRSDPAVIAAYLGDDLAPEQDDLDRSVTSVSRDKPV